MNDFNSFLDVQLMNAEKKKVAKRLSNVEPSGMRKLFDISGGIENAISFGLGDLNIPPPSHVREAMKKSVDKHWNYTANTGIPELREALVEKFRNRYSVDIDPSGEIVVTCGALEALFDIMQAYIEPGDEVLVQDPSFGYFSNQAILAGGVPVRIPLNKDFQLDPDALEEKITPKTKLFVLNFPCNPTGSVMSREDLKRTVEVITEHNILLVSDETYENIVYDGHKHTCALEFGYQNTIVIGSFSKSYSMTGLRVGFVAGNKEVLAPVAQVHQYNTASANATAQYGALAALKGGDKSVNQLVSILKERRDISVRVFGSIKGFDIKVPKGAFYIFPNVKQVGMGGDELSKYVLEKSGVVVVPGSEFGTNENTRNCVRISFGFVDNEQIKEGAERIKSCLEER